MKLGISHPFAAQAGEQGRFEAGRALELRGALLEYAATNLGFVKRNAATWHQLKDAMQPTVWKSTSELGRRGQT